MKNENPIDHAFVVLETAPLEPQAEPISFEHIGGKKVGHHVPVKTEKPIDFSSIGGKCVRPHTAHPMYERAKSVESEDPEESKDATLREEE